MDSSERKSVLFLCTHNSARSQMAEGLLRADQGDRYLACSAGTEATRVHPMAIEVMREIGIDISSHTSKTLDRFVQQPVDVVATVCDAANEACPVFPGAKLQIHRAFEDPSSVIGSEKDQHAAFRRVRNEIRRWLEKTFD